jgi:hypothetical protein
LAYAFFHERPQPAGHQYKKRPMPLSGQRQAAFQEKGSDIPIRITSIDAFISNA